MSIDRFVKIFVLKLVERITSEMEDVTYISKEAIATEIEYKLEDLADFIWEQFKENEDNPS